MMSTTCCYGSSPEDLSGDDDPWKIVRSTLEANQNIRNAVVVVGTKDDGRLLVTEKGRLGITSSSTLESASLIKWITGVTILKLVQEGVIESLNDHPQQYLDWWTSDPNDMRSNVTIQQLLSFTSGFQGKPISVTQTPPCIRGDDDTTTTTTIEECAKQIYNDWFEYIPGTTYYYSPSHHQILASIGLAATGKSSWQSLFEEYVALPLNMTQTIYNVPSESNPRVAGGAISSADDIEAFLLKGILRKKLLDSDFVDTMKADGTPSDEVHFEYSPMTTSGDNINNSSFHYGIGSVWLECPKKIFDNCAPDQIIVSSTGAYGFHAWIDFKTGIYGILAMRQILGDGDTALKAAWELRPFINEAVVLIRNRSRQSSSNSTNSTLQSSQPSDPSSSPTMYHYDNYLMHLSLILIITALTII